ncbi:hypothetical protein [Marinobacter mobilis]|uniref:Uncharacterized protein n=1 Tax=Marinobacter mobilis TaxID=488533 RepID=A0A1H2V857_9GAMM|nr:hypothetical protein [Marinobacter mobilis]SDW64104.1 hypothetical protein SAMN04487960_103356 [Marinobacter mobilis]
MAFWQQLLIQVAITSVVVISIITIFYCFFLKPFLNKKVQELIQASEAIEPKITAGVKRGVTESLRDIPEAAVKDSTRQFLRFGSDLFENGLSSFLGTADDLARRSPSGRRDSSDDRD